MHDARLEVEAETGRFGPASPPGSRRCGFYCIMLNVEAHVLCCAIVEMNGRTLTNLDVERALVAFLIVGACALESHPSNQVRSGLKSIVSTSCALRVTAAWSTAAPRQERATQPCVANGSREKSLQYSGTVGQPIEVGRTEEATQVPSEWTRRIGYRSKVRQGGPTGAERAER